MRTLALAVLALSTPALAATTYRVADLHTVSGTAIDLTADGTVYAQVPDGDHVKAYTIRNGVWASLRLPGDTTDVVDVSDHGNVLGRGVSIHAPVRERPDGGWSWGIAPVFQSTLP